MTTTLTTVALVVLLVFVLSVGGVWWRQERIAYQPPIVNPVAPSGVPRVTYAASDSQRLYAYMIDPPGGAAPRGVLLAFHGNADLATWQIEWATEVATRTGWRVFLAEYRGYGGLSGSPDYVGIRRDARAAWDYVAEHAADSSHPTAVFGHSLGSAVAVELADELRRENRARVPAALLLQSPFTSARDMVRVVSTRPVHALWNVIARVHYDTRTKLAMLATPVWIAHGERDWLVPVAMGKEIYGLLRRPGRLLLVPDAGHNDVAERGDISYWRWMSDALAAASTDLKRPVSDAPVESRSRIGMSG